MYRVRPEHDLVSIKHTIDSIAKRCIDGFNKVADLHGAPILDFEVSDDQIKALFAVSHVINTLCDTDAFSYFDMLQNVVGRIESKEPGGETEVIEQPCTKADALLRIFAHTLVIDELLERPSDNPHFVTKAQVGLGYVSKTEPTQIYSQRYVMPLD